MSRPSLRSLLQAAAPPALLTAMLALVVGFATISVLGSVSGAV
jgi:hypothetical protein